MKIAVTGSSGFIGSKLVKKLHYNGYDVIELSREKGLDICKWNSVKDVPPCNVIVHLAAKTFVPDSFENPRQFYHVNQTATLHSLELARKWGAKMIYMSSYFYGAPQYLPVDESHPLNPHNPYAQTKQISELLCEGYQRDFDVQTIIFRLFNIYGPGQGGDFLIPTILKQLNNGKIILKDPRPRRDYIHIDDVISGIILGIKFKDLGFQRFNLGTGISYSVDELVNFVKKYSDPTPNVVYTHEQRKGEVLDSVADISMAKEKLGWSPEITLEQGIRGLLSS